MLVTPSLRPISRTSPPLPLNSKTEVRATTLSFGIFARTFKQFLGHAVGEIILVGLAAHVGERQDGDRIGPAVVGVATSPLRNDG